MKRAIHTRILNPNSEAAARNLAPNIWKFLNGLQFVDAIRRAGRHGYTSGGTPDATIIRAFRRFAFRFTVLFIFICQILLIGNVRAESQSLSTASLKKIQFEQKLGGSVRPDLQFVDENGAPVRLGQYFDGQPVILLMGYYKCPMLCSLVLNGLVESLQDLKASPGEKFQVLDVSISENEKPSLARAKKRTYVKRYGRPASANGWHFLTGNKENIAALADEIGFRYAYDPVIKEFAHPSGLVVLTPDGKISKYFFGVEFPAAQLNAALKEAGSKKIGSRIRQLFLLCFHYNPINGKYGALIMGTLRAGGIATLIGLVWLIVKLCRGQRRRIAPSPLKKNLGARETMRPISEAEK